MPTWTDQERSRLLLAIIELLVPPRTQNRLPPWPDVAERMGAGFTSEAVRQQYQKLRKDGLPDAGSLPNTPQRNRLIHPAGAKKTPAGRGRGRGRGKRLFAERQESEEDDKESDDNKKIKKEDGQSGFGQRMIVKTERVDDEGVVRLDDDELSSLQVKWSR